MNHAKTVAEIVTEEGLAELQNCTPGSDRRSEAILPDSQDAH